ncbi:MAG: class I SAM-dependent DNA methyltransferase [Methanothrix sp.]|nr:MAG: class I SAM-dependent DNA methyltransferase [Methanothrix sp.]
MDEADDPLPFDNLDNNIIVGDALFVDWPKVNAIIGNPPFQAKNKMREEFGHEYVNKIKKENPGIPGTADYCVYWFRKAHDMLLEGGRAGLVGTKTISQTNSRIGGLDYIVSHDGTIMEAVSKMPWSGDAVVHVSIVNWIKGDVKPGKRKLAMQLGEKKDGPWKEYELDNISSSLSLDIDVAKAKIISINKNPKSCYQGQIHGHEGFLLTPIERQNLIKLEPEAMEVTFPYLTGEDLVGNLYSQPSRFVIDFQPRDSIFEVKKYPKTFSIIKEKVLPKMIENANEEQEEYKYSIKKDNSRQNHLNKWWLLHRKRDALISKLNTIKRYIACSRVTKRPIFEFISSEIHPSDVIQAFSLEDDYSFGILQRSLHWEWFKARCSTLKGDPRYTSETIFNSFPWPQWGNLENLTCKNKKSPIDITREVSKAARNLREIRSKLVFQDKHTLREIYLALEDPGDSPLKEAHKLLDNAVWNAYHCGLPREMQKMNTLEFLLKLNELCTQVEEEGKSIVGPGLPPFCKGHFEFFSDDCIKFIA